MNEKAKAIDVVLRQVDNSATGKPTDLRQAWSTWVGAGRPCVEDAVAQLEGPSITACEQTIEAIRLWVYRDPLNPISTTWASEMTAFLEKLRIRALFNDLENVDQPLFTACTAKHKDCHVSTGIHERLTYGRGELDENGFWEIPCAECPDRPKAEKGK